MAAKQKAKVLIDKQSYTRSKILYAKKGDIVEVINIYGAVAIVKGITPFSIKLDEIELIT